MSGRLAALIARARSATMTAEEIEDQRVSFAYGNTAYENGRVTREDVIRASKALRGEALGSLDICRAPAAVH
jgi:hypothetical protein